MSNDLSRKTLRHFYCRDHLWQCFEQMSESLDRGVDDLVNDAMKAFAQQMGALPREPGARTTGSVAARATTGSRPLPPPPPPPSTRPSASRPAVPPPVPPPVPMAADAPVPPLCLIFGNQRHIIDKEQFIIGRGAKSSDLAIRDGNVSRKHAAVVRRNGAYYIKDLGSTNGIDFQGTRIDNKKIEEGDVFSICEYQLRFTYR
jgi:hypothetical protein